MERQSSTSSYTLKTMTAHSMTLHFPIVVLSPLDDTFTPKQISLAGGEHIIIGRQTNERRVPTEENGLFNSKTLGRRQAEIWEEFGKIFIRDLGSTNGTRINGVRLSDRSVESDPHELVFNDVLQFGCDVYGDDNTTVIHHKVLAQAAPIFNRQQLEAYQQTLFGS